MYRVLRPNKGLVAFEMRGSRDGGGLEVCAHMPLRMPAGVLPGTRACYLAPAPCTMLTHCLPPLGAGLREVRPRVAAGARRGRGSLAQPLSRLRAGTRMACACACACACASRAHVHVHIHVHVPCPCVDACDTCMHTHDMHMHMQHAHAHATCTCTCTLYLPPYAVHPRARVAKLRRAALPVGDAAADRGALRGLHPAAVERHHGHHCHRTSQVPAGDARAPLDGPADRRRQGGPS